MTTILAKLKMRRGTAAEWAASNPVLAEGELAFETDTGRTKIGNGVTGYSALPSYPTLDEMLEAQGIVQSAVADAEAAGTSAAASATAAATSATASQTASTAAGNSAFAASASATAASASAAAAAGSASDADNDRIAAQAASTTANNAKGLAQAAQLAAEAARDQAQASQTSAAGVVAQAADYVEQAYQSAASAAAAATTATANRQATFADREVTTADRTAAAASASAAAASEGSADASADAAGASALAAAGSAATAQSAKEAAVAAKTAAETAMTSADGSADQAVASATAAAASATAAASSATSAASNAAATAADRIATGLDKNAAASSAAVADAAEDAAAASATASANSATASQASRLASEAARDASISARTASETARDAAVVARTGAETARTGAEAAQAAALVSQTAANTSAGLASGSAASALAIYGSVTAQQAAVATAQAQASLAAGHAASAASVVQQDLSGITAQALHRSPNAITAMAIYDTSKDSDGGAWTEKCQHTSWYNEPLMGKWLGAYDNEAQARILGGATLGAELITNGSVSLDTTGWSASNATLQSVDGKLRITGTASGYPSGWQSFTTVVGRAYRVSFTQRTKSGGIFAVNKTDNTNPVGTNRVQLQSNSSNIQVVGYFVATATTSYIHFGLDGINPFTGFWAEYDDISVREVQASNAVPGDYFQLTTDGKFYRLWKNLLNYSQDFDTGNWQRTAISLTANALAAPDGTLTADLLTATGSNAHLLRTAPLGAVAYTFSVYAKRGNSDWFAMSNNGHFAYFNLATGSVGTVGDGSASIQTVGDGWYRCIWVPSDYSWNGAWRVRCAVANGDINTTNQTAYVWGAQLERGTAATAYEPKAAEGSISEVFRGNKADFPRLAAIVGEATNLTIYDLTEPGRPMWMRFNGHGGSSYPGHPLLNTNQTSIAAINGNLIVGGNGAWTSWLLVANFIKETSRWYGASNTGSTHGVWRSNFAQRNTVGQYDLFNGGSENLANNQVNAVAATILPNAPVDPVTGLRNPTIAVATESALSVINAQGAVSPNVSISGWPVNGVSIIGTNVYWEWRGNYSSDVGVASLVGAFPAFTLSRDNSILARNKYNQSSAGGLRAAGAYALKYDIQVNAFFNNRTLSLYRHKAGPLASMGASIHSTHNSGWILSEANGTRRAYLTSCIAGSTGPTVELFPNADFSSTDVSDWTKSNAAISIAINNGGLDFTFTANQQFIFKHVPVTPGKAYRVYLQANNFGLSPVISQTDTIGGSVDTNFTGAYWSNGSGNNSAYYGVEVVPTKPFLLVGYASAGPSTFRITSISVREVDFDRSPRSSAGPFVCAINGTLTKNQVATGTSLVGYSGFSAANYLREAYSPELEFGTGEWSCSAWVNVPSTTPLKGNLVNGSAVASNWGFSLFGISVVNTGETIAGFGTVSKLRWSAGDGPMGREVGSNQVFSFYVKKAEFKILYVRADQSTSVYPSGFWFDMDTGTVLSNTFPAGVITATAAPEVGAGWYRIAVKGSHGNYVKIFVSDDTYSVYHGNTTSGYLICGAQLEVSSVPGPFVQTSGGPTILTLPVASRSNTSGPALTIGMNSEGKLTATSFDGTTARSATTTATYNTATWLKAEACYTTDGTLSIRVNGREVATSRGNPLLSLNSRYNLLLNSEQFDSWGKNQVTVSSNVINAPDGTLTADLILDNTANAEHYVSQSFNCTNGIAYNFTGYLKKRTGSYSTCNIRTYLTGYIIHVVDFDAGTITNGGTLTSVGDGWYKFDITRTASATGTGYLETYTKQNGSNVGTGSDGHYAWGFQVAAANAWNNGYVYQRVGTASDVAFGASLTIGNNFAADAPFPGSIALLKLSATVPTYEQSQFMYEQEKQLFRAGAQCVVPDSNPVIDMAYDDATDRWVAISATNESYWTGLVRNSVTPVPTGNYTRVVAGSGLELVARNAANPGVDVTIPAYGLREEMVKRAEAAARLTKEIVTYDYVGGFTANTTSGNTAITNVSTITYPASYIGARISGSGIPANTTIVAVSGTTIYLSAAATATATGVSISFLDFELPVGMEAKTVMSAGALRREGSTQDYTRLYDGFIETIRFAVAPGATAWVQIQAQRITLQ